MKKEQLEQNIENMKAELAKMEKQLADSDTVELVPQRWKASEDGNPIGTGVANKRFTSLGLTRSTKELAGIASKNMVTRNKLEAYAMQIDPAHRVTDNSCQYYISPYMGRFIVLSNESYRSLGTVYMSESTAQQICEWLNDGRITL